MKKNNTTSNNPISNVHFEEIVQEVCDRQNISSNVIIFGVKEQEALPKNDRINAEKTEVTKMLSYVLPSLDSIGAVHRLGKFDSSRRFPRPLKVTLSNSDQVDELIRKASSLKNNNALKTVSLSFDRTPRQLDLYKQTTKNLKSGKLKEKLI